MYEPSPQERLGAYRHWCRQVALAIKDLDAWLVANELATDETRTAIEVAQAGMHADRLTVGFVPGGGRGTSELINALFFSEYGQRLLPFYAGYVSICPTELCWDPAHTDAYVRLLPVETSALGIPFDQLRADPRFWVEYPLDVEDAEKTVTRLSEIAQTKVVSRANAARLGIDLVEPAPGGLAAEAPVEIPKWRYAILSVPSPLLQLGLVVLNVPALDSRWREPDLAIVLLAGAQCIVSVLAVGQEDWAADLQLLQHCNLAAAGSLVVALNKVDRLWTEGGGVGVEPVIAERRAAAAAALGVDEVQVFPVSAQKALIARMRGDTALLGATGIEALEAHLLTELVRARRQFHRGALDQVLGGILDQSRACLSARLDRAKSHLAELEEFRVKTIEGTGSPLGKISQEQEVYRRSVKRLQACRADLVRATGRCRERLNRDRFEALVVQTYTDMARSWTTVGMASAMKVVFDELRSVMQVIATEGERAPKLVCELYSGLRREFGYELSAPKGFFPLSLGVEIETLRHEAEAFRHSSGMALARKGAVIKRFQEKLVAPAQVLFDQLLDALDAWTRDALQPLAEQIEANKVVMERRLDDLQRPVHAKDDVQCRLSDAHSDYVALVHQLTALRNIHNALRQDTVWEQSTRQPSALVAELSSARVGCRLTP